MVVVVVVVVAVLVAVGNDSDKIDNNDWLRFQQSFWTNSLACAQRPTIPLIWPTPETTTTTKKTIIVIACGWIAP